MNKESSERIKIAEERSSENDRQRYLELGGIINEQDYRSALDRMKDEFNTKDVSIINSVRQGINIAEYAGIQLNASTEKIDPRIMLYAILRNDVKPEGIKYHHSQMSDQHIFVEALRMLGDKESLEKIIEAYPNISFRYEKKG